MTPEDKALIFDHVKNTLLPTSELKTKTLVAQELRKAETINTKRIKEIQRLEPLLEEKIKTLNELLLEVNKKIGEVSDFDARLTQVEKDRNKVDEDALLDALIRRLREG